MSASGSEPPAPPAFFMRPLIPAALAFMAGIFWGAWAPGAFVVRIAVVCAMSVLLVRQVRLRRGALVLPLLFCAALGDLSIQPWLGRALPADHVARFADQGKWQVSGRVDGPVEGAGAQRQFVLNADGLAQGGRGIAVRGKIRISVRGRLPDLNRGDRLTLSGHLHLIHGFMNPDGFDYERFMALQGLHARLYAQADTLRIEAAGADGAARLDRLRRSLAQRMDAVLRDDPPALPALLKALTLGERDGLGAELKEAFSRAGVSHVLAISGLHIGMVATASFAFFSWWLVWLPPMLARGWVRRAAAVSSLPPIIGYGLLAGLSASTQRAMIMAGVFLLTFWIGRRQDWFNALAAAALAILVAAPPALMGVSFQLSFAAVLTILLGMKALPFPAVRAADAWPRRWRARVLGLLGVSLLATIGTAPLVMHYFNQISWVGPLSNLLVVPLVGTLVVPAGLLGIVLAPLSTLFCGLCWKTAALGLGVVVWWVEGIARWPFAAATTVTPSVAEIGLCYLLLATLFLWRMPVVRMLGLAFVLVAGGLDATYWYHRRFGRRQIVATVLDVGQGSANALQLPGGFTVLVDGGGFSDNTAFDVGRSILAPWLWANKIKTIDLVVLSHADSDHLNGLLYILAHFKVKRIWSNHETVRTLGYRKWQELVEQRRIVHEPFDELPAGTLDNGVRLEVLGPSPDFLQRRSAEPWRDLNNNSLVVRVSWNAVSFLFAGDIKAAAERELVRRKGAEDLRSTILCVPHHGSRSSSTADFLEAVGPREAVISVGWKNRFKFPHPDVLQRLQASGCRVWRTDHCGAIQITTDGAGYQVRTCRKGCP